MAPELLELLPPRLRSRGRLEYTNAVDIWALGVVIYEILASKGPFQICPPDNQPQTLSAESHYSGVAPMRGAFPVDTFLLSEFCKGNMAFPTVSLRKTETSQTVIKFVQKLLVADPKSRMTAADGLGNPWMLEI